MLTVQSELYFDIVILTYLYLFTSLTDQNSVLRVSVKAFSNIGITGRMEKRGIKSDSRVI